MLAFWSSALDTGVSSSLREWRNAPAATAAAATITPAILVFKARFSEKCH
jgi:anti-sigma-K factor RskA